MVAIQSILTAASMAAAAFAAPIESRSSISSKRGLAYDYSTKLNLFSNHGLSWSYNWNADPTTTSTIGEFVPMLLGQKDFDSWGTILSSLSGVSHILGFNEPDHSGDTQMSASDAVTYYKKYITPYHSKASLGTPAVTSDVAEGKGLQWMEKFLTQCNGDCDIDFMVVHWYADSGVDGTKNAQDFLNFVDKAVALANQNNIEKIWITEFGFGYDSSVERSERVTFLRKVLPQLDNNDSVERYSYFLDLNLQGNSDSLGQEAQVYLSS
ncbi:hypothetical protein KEM55_003410 [Ascosphaera atra]|nr:hypothetical protein KEM55_003410 [Ascosphaera atra]